MWFIVMFGTLITTVANFVVLVLTGFDLRVLGAFAVSSTLFAWANFRLDRECLDHPNQGSPHLRGKGW